MNWTILKSVAVSVAALVFSGAAAASQLTVTSYDTPNGDGQANGGTYNYWDANYTGLGAKTTDGAVLSGGLGALTDGVTTTSLWFNVSNNAGTGPYVGWLDQATHDPTVTFHFSGSPTITDMKVWLDNSGAGGVFAPTAVLIDGVSHAFTAPTFGTAGVVDFAGLSLTGGSHTVQFDQGKGEWVFVNEVSFFGSSAPEPAAWALMILGLGFTGAALRRRPAVAAA